MDAAFSPSLFNDVLGRDFIDEDLSAVYDAASAAGPVRPIPVAPVDGNKEATP